MKRNLARVLAGSAAGLVYLLGGAELAGALLTAAAGVFGYEALRLTWALRLEVTVQGQARDQADPPDSGQTANGKRG